MSPVLRLLATAVFTFTLALWTWALLEPRPVPEVISRGLGVDWEFILAKCLHAGGYAFLAWSGCMAAGGRWRWLVPLLMCHGAATEWGQWAMDVGRHGCVRDVLVDWGGIGLGIAVWRLILSRGAAAVSQGREPLDRPGEEVEAP